MRSHGSSSNCPFLLLQFTPWLLFQLPSSKCINSPDSCSNCPGSNCPSSHQPGPVPTAHPVSTAPASSALAFMVFVPSHQLFLVPWFPRLLLITLPDSHHFGSHCPLVPIGPSHRSAGSHGPSSNCTGFHGSHSNCPSSQLLQFPWLQGHFADVNESDVGAPGSAVGG
jgi:hypothetical protein